MRTAYAAAIGATLALAACGASTSTTTTSFSAVSTPTPSSSPSVSVSGSTTTAASGCAFNATIGGGNAYAGHQVMTVTLTNTGTGTCTLNGYPVVQLQDGSGQINTALSESNSGGQAATATPSGVLVSVGGKASFVMEFSDVGSTTCPTIASGSATLPGWNGNLSLTFGANFTPCPPTFVVGAVTS